MTKILLIHGPNFNMLGKREPQIYGTETLADLEKKCIDHAAQYDFSIDCYQSNHEGEIIESVHAAIDQYDAVIINAGAYTHTSIAIHDALKLLSCPIFEVHISNIEEREEFRRHSYITPVAAALIMGQGTDGYLQAIDKIRETINSSGE
ncbi:MAG: type II 3-dehydroquinate dehydratase [Pseudomonadota bacterium]